MALKSPMPFLYALYLFTRSDIKTILLPIVVFAWYSSPLVSLRSFLSAALWTWLHLLQFCVSNQSLSPHEDALNKPWRPVPSGRITLRTAAALRWLLLPLCFLCSIHYNVLSAGIVFPIGVLLHNELKLDSHWFTRNALNALGYAVFDAGATTIAHTGRIDQLPAAVLMAHYFSIAIVLTTIHAQDFRDEAGDRAGKRNTIPIVMPRFSRLSMLVGPLLWSATLGIVCSCSLAFSVILSALAALIGLRFYLLRTPESDRTSYVLYNVWLGLARITPILFS